MMLCIVICSTAIYYKVGWDNTVVTGAIRSNKSGPRMPQFWHLTVYLHECVCLKHNTEELLHVVPFKSFQFCLVYIIENNCGFTGLRCPAWASTATGSSRHDISARMFDKVYLTPELWDDVCGVICFILLLFAILKITLWLSITCQLTLLSMNKMAAVSQTTFF